MCSREMIPVAGRSQPLLAAMSFALAHLAYVCLLLSAFACLAQAEYIDPGVVDVKTTSYSPPQRQYSPGTYHYKVSWQGIPVAEASVEVRRQNKQDKPFYHVSAKAKTGDFIEVFYKLRHVSESLFEAQTLKPAKFYTYQKDRRDEKLRKVIFENGRVVSTGQRTGVEDTSVSFATENAVFDPISAAFMARSLPVDIGTRASFDVFNGKHRYLISFVVDARERISIAGRGYDAYRVTPTIKKLTDSEGEKRLKYAVLWISADESREVLRLESKVLVGKISIVLERFVPAEADTVDPDTFDGEFVNASLIENDPDLRSLE